MLITIHSMVCEVHKDQQGIPMKLMAIGIHDMQILASN
jgi:hypothetical protein